MLLKRWRVGSLSMGLILLTSGILMLVSFIKRINMIDVIIMLWPIVLICLGIEILLHLFLKKDDEKIKYDALSIVFISFIIFISTLFYALNFTYELFGSKEDFYAAIGFRNQTAYYEAGAKFEGASELAVFDFINKITVIPGSGDSIKAEFKISIETSDKNYAEDYMDRLLDIRKGEKAFVMINDTFIINDNRLGYPSISAVIYLPEGKILDLSQSHGNYTYDKSLESQIKK